MKKILFIVVGLIFSVSCLAEELKYREMEVIYSAYLWRYELTPRGDIYSTQEVNTHSHYKYNFFGGFKEIKEVSGTPCKTTIRKLKIFSVHENGSAWGYSDSILVLLRFDKKLAKKIRKDYKISWISPEKLPEITQPIIGKITERQKPGIQVLVNRLRSINDSLGDYHAKNKQLIKNNEDVFLWCYGGLYQDGVGGCEPEFEIINCAKKTIKYIYITCNFYNRVDDIVTDKITGEKNIKYTITGPYKYLSKISANSWDSKFYKSTAAYFTIISMKIEYMDGSCVSFNTQQIEEHKTPTLKNVVYGIYDTEISQLNEEYNRILKTHEHQRRYVGIVTYNEYGGRVENEKVYCAFDIANEQIKSEN